VPVAAFTPVVNLIEPRGVQRGTEAVVTFVGDRLYDPREVIFYHPGITARKIEKVGDDHKRVKVSLTIAADAALGEHPMRLRCKGGVSWMRTLWVGQFPTVFEKRQDKKDLNNDFNAPQEVPLNSTVQGVADREDVDYYRVACRKGQRLSVEVEGMRLGRVLFDPYVAILDQNRFELASSDDAPLLNRDSALSLVVPEDGNYTIMVRESSYQGQPTCQYRLHIGEFPRPTAVYPPGGRPGEERKFTFIGDAAGETTTELALPNEETEIRAFARAGDLLAPSGNPVRVSSIPYYNEKEPNEGSAEATPVGEAPMVPIAFHGVISKKEDKDWFRFAARKGQKIRVQVYARQLRSPLDSYIIVRNAKDGKQIGNNDDGTQRQPDSRLDFDVPEDGEYLVNIRDQLYGSGPDYTYRIEVGPRRPAISASFPYAQRNISQKWKVISVPRGNRVAKVVNISRANIGCDIECAADGLPGGVRLDVDPAPRSVTSFPMVFEAAPDAPLEGGLYRFTVKDPKSGLTGPLKEAIHHIEVNNAGTFHTTRSERLAVAVIEKAPFEIQLEVPPVPLVRNGVMLLTARARRDEGFDAPIKVTLPWKPPGVGGPTSVDIKKGENEATIQINANGEAPVRSWRICILAEATTKRGPVLVSSRLQTLDVGEPYLGVKIEMAATQPGKNTDMLCKIEQLKPFDGNARLILQGLPHGVSASEVSITSDSKEVIFPLEVTGEARKGKHATIFCQAVVTKDGHPVTSTASPKGVLRIDPPPPAPKKPAPEKKDAPAEAAAKAAEPKKQPAKKPLSRLEQLRQQAGK
ncbi:MAG: peptidase, partial [Akkermansiaceae bacterium]|nr:peptidase [Akkermansiaceae bacterium]